MKHVAVAVLAVLAAALLLVLARPADIAAEARQPECEECVLQFYENVGSCTSSPWFIECYMDAQDEFYACMDAAGCEGP